MIPSLAVVAALMGIASAHMEMQYPAPLRSKYNANVPSGNVDYDMTSPLDASGADFPCKGYLGDLSSAAGASTATLAAGQPANMTITGGANHDGGSCQISLSTDQGKSFSVIQSIIGNCPAAGTSNLDFTVPSDAPAGDAVLAWTWHNQVGNREMYMNCAAVTITGGAARKSRRAETALADRPGIWIANVGAAGDNCVTEEGVDIDYPEPGPDVQNTSTKPGKPSCGVTQKSGSGSSSGSSSSGESSGSSSSSSASSAAAGGIFATSAAAPAATTSAEAAPPAAATTSAAEAAPPAAATTAASSNTSSSGAQTAGSACTDEGAWLCLGKSYQRCASGVWSVEMPMAAGTSCTAGTDGAFETVADAKRRRGLRSARRVVV